MEKLKMELSIYIYVLSDTKNSRFETIDKRAFLEFLNFNTIEKEQEKQMHKWMKDNTSWLVKDFFFDDVYIGTVRNKIDKLKNESFKKSIILNYNHINSIDKLFKEYPFSPFLYTLIMGFIE